MKKYIKVRSHWIDYYSSFTPQSLEDLAKDMVARGVISVSVDSESDYGSLGAFEERLETEKEYQKRIKVEAKETEKNKHNAELIRVRELRELERLQKKYSKV